MMNLAELQAKIKGLPDQYLAQSLTGQSSEVPPWVALIEKNRRDKMRASAAAAQPAPPTVKDQVMSRGIAMLPRRGGAMPVGPMMQRGFAGGGQIEKMIDFENFITQGQTPRSPLAGIPNDLRNSYEIVVTGKYPGTGQAVSPQERMMHVGILESRGVKPPLAPEHTRISVDPVAPSGPITPNIDGSMPGGLSSIEEVSRPRAVGKAGGRRPVDSTMPYDSFSEPANTENEMRAERIQRNVQDAAGGIIGLPSRAIEAGADAMTNAGLGLAAMVNQGSGSLVSAVDPEYGARLMDTADDLRTLRDQRQSAPDVNDPRGDQVRATPGPAADGGISTLRPQERPTTAEASTVNTSNDGAPATTATTATPSGASTAAEAVDRAAPGLSPSAKADAVQGAARMQQTNQANEEYKIDVMGRMAELDRLQRERAKSAFDYALMATGSAMAGAQTPWGSQAFAAGMDAGLGSLKESAQTEFDQTKELLGIENAYQVQQEKMALARMAAAARGRRGGGGGSKGSVGGDKTYWRGVMNDIRDPQKRMEWAQAYALENDMDPQQVYKQAPALIRMEALMATQIQVPSLVEPGDDDNVVNE